MKFVWSEVAKFVAGAGGTENHTLERARELQRRFIPVEIIIISNNPYDPGFSDIPFIFLPSVKLLSEIDDTIIYIARGQDVDTMKQSYIFLHFPITHVDQSSRVTFLRAINRSKLITNSQFSRRHWSDTLAMKEREIAVVYPFAHPKFGSIPARRDGAPCRVLYPNRITPEKGLFVFLEAAHILGDKQKYEFIVTGAGNTTQCGKQTEAWLRQVSRITYLPPLVTRGSMAELMSSVDIVVVPSRNDYWQEPFGMTSVEGQHAGCRVIVSDSGGLSETGCGLLDIIEPGNAYKLARQIEKVSTRPPVTDTDRAKAREHFTLKQNVDAFLQVVTQ